jgi:hypothetical protein
MEIVSQQMEMVCRATEKTVKNIYLAADLKKLNLNWPVSFTRCLHSNSRSLCVANDHISYSSNGQEIAVFIMTLYPR